MKSYTPDEVYSSLQQLGLSNGDVVMVHSSLFALGRIDGNGVSIRETDRVFFEALRACVGDAGTIAVPAFNFQFCKGEPFDLHNTPSQNMGNFSEYVRKLPDTIRSPHPMQSVCANGRDAHPICKGDTLSSFDPEGAFHQLLELDATLVLLGANIQAVSIIHYAEERSLVPYRYWKNFRGEYHAHGTTSTKEYRMYVRDMDLDPKIKMYNIETELRKNGQIRTATLGSGEVRAFKCKDFIKIATENIAQNPNYLLL